jgi:molybdenum cofactor cytidylyltransferase
MSDKAAVALAAGLHRRMDEANKLLLSVRGDILLCRVVVACAATTDHPVNAVIGYQEDAVKDALHDVPVVIVHNSRFEENQMTSVDAGLGGAPAAKTYLAALGDQPKITSDCLRDLLEVHHAGAGGRMTVPMVDGIRGNPIVVPTAQPARILADLVNLGCRNLTRTSTEIVPHFTTTDDSFVVDVDTPEDLALVRFELQ